MADDKKKMVEWHTVIILLALAGIGYGAFRLLGVVQLLAADGFLTAPGLLIAVAFLGGGVLIGAAGSCLHLEVDAAAGVARTWRGLGRQWQLREATYGEGSKVVLKWVKTGGKRKLRLIVASPDRSSQALFTVSDTGQLRRLGGWLSENSGLPLEDQTSQ